MASTTRVATPLNPVGVAYGEGRKINFGVAVLATGTVELDTGLSNVHAFFATCLDDTNTETVVFRVREDLPTATGTLTVDGTLVDEGSAIGNAVAQNFSWIAVGY